MNLIYLALLYGLIATIFVYKSEARLHAESIVGGIAAAVGQNTYAVSIQVNNQHVAGGAILNNRHIITAAHTFIDPRTNRFITAECTVVAGVTNAHSRGEYRVEREVEKVYIRREYNPIIAPNDRRKLIADIAVLELTADLGFNPFITNVVLPPIERPPPTYENQQAVVCAYGDNWVNMRRDPRTNRNVEYSGSYSHERRFAEVNILSHMACLNFFRGIVDSHLCGHMRQRSPADPEGLCTGDSGSPLVIGNTIIGVVSISPVGCKENLSPAIYTRVTSFTPFIMNAMNRIRTPNMRLAIYEDIPCGPRCHRKELVEK